MGASSTPNCPPTPTVTHTWWKPPTPLSLTRRSIYAIVNKILNITLTGPTGIIFAMSFVRFAVLLAVFNALNRDVQAWTSAVAAAAVPGRRLASTSSSTTSLYHAPKNVPKHDVGGDPFSSLPEDQKLRAMAYMEHQQGVPKPGFPADVRSLVQYNHGFAVMSTNSKS